MLLPNNTELTNYPINLVLEITTKCNFRCSICPYPTMKRKKNKTMSFKLYKKIIDEIALENPEKTNIWFAFMGEPLLVANIDKYIKYAHGKIKNLFLNTNASNLLKMAHKIKKVGRIFVSMDAFNKSSYDRIRCGGNYHKITKDLLEYLKRVDRPEVIIQFIVTKDNFDEKEKFIDFWRNQCAGVKVRSQLGWGDKFDSLLAPRDRNIPCGWLMRQMVVLCDGRVAQCDADYEGEHCQGNINKQDIFSVWNNELLEKRCRHLRHDFDFEPCKSCNDWQVGLSKIYVP